VGGKEKKRAKLAGCYLISVDELPFLFFKHGTRNAERTPVPVPKAKA
jgi:hypothetical protein